MLNIFQITSFFVFVCRNLTITFNCHHHICLPCFKQYAIINLNRRQFKYDPDIGYSLGCPCGCSNTLLRELHIFRLMDQSNVCLAKKDE